jgi:single-strand DNA-binding protein
VTEVIAENIVLLGSGRREDEESSGPSSHSEQNSGSARTHSDAVSSGDMGSLREEDGFEDEFPLDFSEMGGTEGPGDVQIPF